MNKERGAEQAILFCAVLFKDDELYRKVEKLLKKKWGSLLIKSQVFPFRFTDYYREEMGENLKKVFLLFHSFVPQEKIYSWKRWTNSLERRYSSGGRRRINLDPGYFTLSKLVLASTKNYSHRIYIRKDIYAEITLNYCRETYRGFDWSYPDYKDDQSIEFLNNARKLLKRQIEESK